jgi:hypothetical protein
MQKDIKGIVFWVKICWFLMLEETFIRLKGHLFNKIRAPVTPPENGFHFFVIDVTAIIVLNWESDY